MFEKFKILLKFNRFSLGLALVLAGGLTIDWVSVARAQDNDLDQMRTEREQFVKEIRRVENLNKKYSQEIQDVKETMGKQQEEFNQRVNQLEEKMVKRQSAPKKEKNKTSGAITAQMEQQTYDILSRGAQLNPNDENFREELAGAHYNMGNIFFERGEYQRAIVEYFQAVDLSPYDADTHYNLAFVSSEYLKDQETALKHYQWYIYLKPDADDIDLVREKMIAAKLSIRARIDSPLDKDRGFENIVR